MSQTNHTPINEAQREAWDRNGWLVIKGMVSDRLDELAQWVSDIESWFDAGGPGYHHREQTPAGPRLARSEDFDPYLPAVSEFLRRGPLAPILEDLFGEPAVLFKEKINYKHAGGGGFLAHQDATAYNQCDHHISVMIALDAANTSNGCLYFAPGHHQGLLPHTNGVIDSAWVAAAAWQPVEVEPGDVVFFDSYAPHYSDGNTSDSARTIMYLTYNAASKGDLREAYYADKKAKLVTAESAVGGVRISVNDDFTGIPVDEPA